MRFIGPALIGGILLACLVIPGCVEDAPAPAPLPLPLPIRPKPAPKPAPKPEPPKPKRPWGPHPCPRSVGFASDCGCGEKCECEDCRCQAVGAAVDGNEHDGVEILCPLPDDMHTKNVGGSDGAGLCVFCSMHHSGLWCDEPVFAAIFDWMKRHPGGGYPDKVTKMVRQCAAELGLPEPDYLQVTGHDLEILRAACASGRMPGVTYSFSPSGRYNGQRISHMVSLVHADQRYFVVLDNNYVTGAQHLEWLTPDEFARTYAPGWAVIPLKPGPPYPPRNSEI